MTNALLQATDSSITTLNSVKLALGLTASGVTEIFPDFSGIPDFHKSKFSMKNL